MNLLIDEAWRTLFRRLAEQLVYGASLDPPVPLPTLTFDAGAAMAANLAAAYAPPGFEDA